MIFNINTRSPTVHCANSVKWNTHFPSSKWVESRLPWRQLRTTINLSHLEVLERLVNGLKQMDFALHHICLM